MLLLIFVKLVDGENAVESGCCASTNITRISKDRLGDLQVRTHRTAAVFNYRLVSRMFFGDVGGATFGKHATSPVAFMLGEIA